MLRDYERPKEMRATCGDYEREFQKQFEAGCCTKSVLEKKWAPLPKGYKYASEGVKTSWVPSRSF